MPAFKRTKADWNNSETRNPDYPVGSYYVAPGIYVDPVRVKRYDVAPSYLICDDGSLFSLKRGKIKNLATTFSHEYKIVKLRFSRKIIWRYVHRIVAETFIGPAPTPQHEVNHKDLNKLNNHVSNLEWVTRQENVDHYWGRKKP